MDDKYETNMTTEMTADQVRSMGILRGYSHNFSMASLVFLSSSGSGSGSTSNVKLQN